MGEKSPGTRHTPAPRGRKTEAASRLSGVREWPPGPPDDDRLGLAQPFSPALESTAGKGVGMRRRFENDSRSIEPAGRRVVATEPPTPRKAIEGTDG